MTQIKLIFLSGLILAFLGCTSPTNKQTDPSKQFEGSDSNSLKKNETTEDLNEEQLNNECVRGKAEPVVQKEDYPNTSFVLQPDSLTAIETVSFDNGDKLIIHNWGCEYYVLTFRFETSQYQRDTSDLVFWFRTAQKLMTGMLGALDAPVDIKKGLVMLESYVLRDEKNGFVNLQLGEEIDFGGTDIRSFVTLDKIEKIGDKKFALSVSFSTGPL